MSTKERCGVANVEGDVTEGLSDLSEVTLFRQIIGLLSDRRMNYI